MPVQRSGVIAVRYGNSEVAPTLSCWKSSVQPTGAQTGSTDCGTGAGGIGVGIGFGGGTGFGGGAGFGCGFGFGSGFATSTTGPFDSGIVSPSSSGRPSVTLFFNFGRLAPLNDGSRMTSPSAPLRTVSSSTSCPFFFDAVPYTTAEASCSFAIAMAASAEFSRSDSSSTTSVTPSTSGSVSTT